VLLTVDPHPDDPILGYQDVRASIGLERRLLDLFGAISHNVQLNRPFTYSGQLDPDLGTAVVSYPELHTKLDLRDDSVNPHKGFYAENRLQVAGVGGDAIDVKVEPEARVYLPLGRRLTLATRGGVGLLFPNNYGQTVRPNAFTGQPGGASRTEWVRDVQLMFLRGLFLGGSTSNRGYQSREIGPHGVVPFYNPGQSTADIIDACAPGQPESDRSRCQLPLGGFTLWEAGVELRFPVLGPLRGALFADAGDVSPEILLFRFNRPHLSVGLGARYDTPLGPVRLDVGYRVPGLQAPNDAPDEGVPSDVFGLPIAVAFGIGVPF
jgi:outer membrane protein insertion porin family/translocation and assembly module TamA